MDRFRIVGIVDPIGEDDGDRWAQGVVVLSRLHSRRIEPAEIEHDPLHLIFQGQPFDLHLDVDSRSVGQ